MGGKLNASIELSYINTMTFVALPRFLCVISLLILVISACESGPVDLNTLSRTATLATPRGEILRTTLALTDAEQTRGLSGTVSSQWAADQAMLFIYAESAMRRFWMPDTYFDLDIFFLDGDLKIIDVERNVKHHPGREVPPEIVTTRTVHAQHVLEMRADSPLSKTLAKGESLKFKSERDLKSIVGAMKMRGASTVH